MQLYLSEPGLIDTGDVYLAGQAAGMETENEKTRAGGRTVSFNGYGGGVCHSKRRPNTRDNGVRETFYAATWDQWGVLLSVLFDLDPGMKVGSRKRPIYDGAEDFHRQTDERFRDVRTLGNLPDYHGDHTFRYDGVSQRCTKCSARSIR